jgi:hypothetical protein
MAWFPITFPSALIISATILYRLVFSINGEGGFILFAGQSIPHASVLPVARRPVFTVCITSFIVIN